MLYELVAGYVPLRAPNLKLLKHVILRGAYQWPSKINSQVKDLISKMLLIEPNDRIPVR